MTTPVSPRTPSAAAFALVVALAGCATRPAVVPVGVDLVAAPSVERFPFAQIVDAWCSDTGCTVLTSEGLQPHTGAPVTPVPPGPWTGLGRTDGGAWVLERTVDGSRCTQTLGDPAGCVPAPSSPVPMVEDVPAIVDQVARFRTVWNAAIAGHGRLPFVPTLATPDGGVIALARGSDGRGQLFRSGGMPKMVPVPTASSPATWPAPFALHPSGTEAYLLSWPSTTVRAFDPFTLATRWSASLDGPAHGLFVDGSGRFLLAATGADDPDRFADWPLPWPAPDAPCCTDEVLAAGPRPPQDHVVVVDLARHAVAARAAGRYRHWALGSGVAWLVTDREVVRIPVAAPPA